MVEEIVLLDENDVETVVKLYAAGLLVSEYIFDQVAKEIEIVVVEYNDNDLMVKLYDIDR
jgi:hypothetical protein